MSRFLLLASISSIALAPYALAQESDELREETIIVSTPGPDRSADELIGNATALGREELLENLSGTLGDTLDRQPGVSTTFFGPGASRPVLRGLGAERVQVLTNGIGVIDVSAASPDHQVTADAIDAKSVEILRGPAALAYGAFPFDNVTVNALVVSTGDEPPSELTAYFQTQVLRGPGAFLEVARGFDDYEDAMIRKLLRELAAQALSLHDLDTWDHLAADDIPG